MVAFFAAQAHERAPELPQPADAARSRENYFGLFSFVLAQMLAGSDEALTYRQLGERTTARYRAYRGSRGPHPIFVGDVDQPVLGVRDVQAARSCCSVTGRDCLSPRERRPA